MFVHQRDRDENGREGHFRQKEELRESKGMENSAWTWGAATRLPLSGAWIWGTELPISGSRRGQGKPGTDLRSGEVGRDKAGTSSRLWLWGAWVNFVGNGEPLERFN